MEKPKRKPGRPRSPRRARTIKMLDCVYEWLVYRGNGKACDGLESIYISAGVKGRLRVPK